MENNLSTILGLAPCPLENIVDLTFIISESRIVSDHFSDFNYGVVKSDMFRVVPHLLKRFESFGFIHYEFSKIGKTDYYDLVLYY